MEKSIAQLLKENKVRPIAYYSIFASITGSVPAGLLLSQIIYWDRVKKNKPFYKTDEEFRCELGNMGEYVFKSAKQLVISTELVTTTLHRIPATTHYLFNREQFAKRINEYFKNQDGGKTANCVVDNQPTITEITTETTSSIPERREISKEDIGVRDSVGIQGGTIEAASASISQEDRAKPNKEPSAKNSNSYEQYIQKRQEWSNSFRSIPIIEVAERLHLTITRDGKLLCPHGENTPSLDLGMKQRSTQFKCFGCPNSGGPIDFVMLMKGLSFLDACDLLGSLFGIQKPEKPSSIKTYPQEYINYLKDHGLTSQEFKSYGYYSKQFGGSVAIKVPTGTRYRVLSAKEGQEKYRNKKGTTACVFRTKPSDDGIVIVCEGEMDAISLHIRTGLTAWSSTAGANTVKPEFQAEFNGNQTVFIVMDNDTSGQAGAEKWKDLLGEMAEIITLPALYHDIGDFFAQGGTKEAFIELLSQQTALNFAEYVGTQLIKQPVRL